MKKKPYDVYSPEIYPRLLFVSTNIEDLDKYFIFLDVYGNNDGSEYNKLLQEIDKYDGGMVTCKVIRKSDNKYGVIVIAVTNTEDITPDMIPHEAVHVADYFCEQLRLTSRIVYPFERGKFLAQKLREISALRYSLHLSL